MVPTSRHQDLWDQQRRRPLYSLLSPHLRRGATIANIVGTSGSGPKRSTGPTVAPTALFVGRSGKHVQRCMTSFRFCLVSSLAMRRFLLVYYSYPPTIQPDPKPSAECPESYKVALLWIFEQWYCAAFRDFELLTPSFLQHWTLLVAMLCK